MNDLNETVKCNNKYVHTTLFITDKAVMCFVCTGHDFTVCISLLGSMAVAVDQYQHTVV